VLVEVVFLVFKVTNYTMNMTMYKRIKESLKESLKLKVKSMKKGKIVSISHELSDDGPFKSYKEIKRHWKNHAF
jgi:effector-binding domain-containing protein